jgi:arsenite-transporting ATPase
MRIILYTGKGGVGKTCISAATAVKCANLGYKTVVLSTDAAHSLSDSLDIPIGDEIKQITPKLYAQEINVQHEMRRNWGQIKSFIVDFLSKQGMKGLIAEEFAIFPGMEELFSLLKLKEYHEQQQFDLAIIDCAPTGSTMRLLNMPNILGWYMEHFFHLERRIVKMVKPVVEKVYNNVLLPTDEVYFSVEDLYSRISGLQEILTDPDQCSVRLVCNPEKMVIKESQRAYTYLSLFGFTVDAVVANKVLPPTVKDPYFAKWQEIQQKYMEYARAAFHPLTVFQARLFDNEMVGLEALEVLGETIYQEQDPAQIFYREKPFSIEKNNGGYDLYIKLPFADKRDMNMWVKGDELILEIGNFKTNTLLPGNLINLPLKEAVFQDHRLKVTFGGELHESAE